MTILSDNVAELLRRAKTQAEVADAIGINQSTISRIANGAKPKPENLEAIARYAGQPIDVLVSVPIAEWRKADPAGFQKQRVKRGWSHAIVAQQAYAIIRREGGSATVTASMVAEFEAGEGNQSPEWLRFALMAFEEGEAPLNQVTLPRDDLAYVRQVDIRYAMGDGTAIEDYPETSLVPFNDKFLRSLTRAPLEKLIMATGQGDSMDPTIKEHDLVLIDATETRIALGDTVWAFEYAGAGYIKRLRPMMKDGKRVIEVISDNEEVAKPFTADPHDIHIVGKVILMVRTRP